MDGYSEARVTKRFSQLAGFEPTRAEPIGFQVQRLNHSATTAQSTTFAKKLLEMRGIEPRAFHMQSERSTTELHPRTRVENLKHEEEDEDQRDGETKFVHVPTGGLEPPIFGLGDRRLIH